MMYLIDTQDSVNDLISYVKEENLAAIKINQNLVTLSNDIQLSFSNEYQSYISQIPQNIQKYDPLIFGKDPTENIVSLECDDDLFYIYREIKGKVTCEVKPMKYWLVSSRLPNSNYTRLDGNSFYKYLQCFDNFGNYNDVKKEAYKKNINFFYIYNSVEAMMALDGYTYFKGMSLYDLTVLSTDIETTTLNPKDRNAKVLTISNTYRKNGEIKRKYFSVDQYQSSADMILAWVDFVQKLDPSILIGHNIYTFDLPYMEQIAGNLYLGRDGSKLKFATKASKIRKDGSQSYEYFKVKIHGREVIDTWFLSLTYDKDRNYPSYKLKEIIQYECEETQKLLDKGKEVSEVKKAMLEHQKTRTFYDASQIGKNWDNLEERKKIKAYNIDDSDDALFCFDFMIPALFYLSQSIPKTFQAMNESATGTQINSFMVRAYLQQKHSLPKVTDSAEYEGAISFGNPGIYTNVFKIDVASLYPSIMLQYDVYNPDKDPKRLFLKSLDYFRQERLKNKKLFKETKNPIYKDLSEGQKVFINSAYGSLGTEGLIFNSPNCAGFVTRKGREIIKEAILWSSGYELDHILKKEGKPDKGRKWILANQIHKGKGFDIVNCDTDAISICRHDKSEISKEERKQIIEEINKNFPELINFEDDGYFKKVIVIKAKNYILVPEEGDIKYKGSSIVDQKKEPALLEFMKGIVDLIIAEKENEINNLYQKYIKEVWNITDIKRWCVKKTVTKSVLESEEKEDGRANETKVLSAITGEEGINEGDKIYVYYVRGNDEYDDSEDELRLSQYWEHNENRIRLTKRVYATLDIFKPILDMSQFVKYFNKKQRPLLEELIK